MPICEKRKIAFCHVPRTGGVSVCNALGLKIVDRHNPASWYRENYPDYFLFTVLRNYDDRIKSTFGWKNEEAYGQRDLDTLVEQVKNRNPEDHTGLMLKPNEFFLDCPVDYTIRFEHLQQDFDKMMEKLGFETVLLIKCNSFR